MKNYIVRNCPALLRMSKVCDDFSGSRCTARPCKDITDCLLKQIVDECNNAKQSAKDYSTNAYSGGMYNEANRILELLEIEECE